ncbi:MAG: YcgL domain-containing protein [Gammaproteobacteria bacterium]|nr:YcgL domain-containing protein [Gammaproteobacteria bacterium]NVK88688.1 YcgL domain-containing protein [Gammaproteobacteria bacterium]
MICFVYRSPKKDEMYLYLTKRDDFSAVPEALLKAFGEPEFALQLNLAKRDKLAREDIAEVKQQLTEQGFFLQMPPRIESLLNQPDVA